MDKLAPPVCMLRSGGVALKHCSACLDMPSVRGWENQELGLDFIDVLLVNFPVRPIL